jgi:hypothetical protein
MKRRTAGWLATGLLLLLGVAMGGQVLGQPGPKAVSVKSLTIAGEVKPGHPVDLTLRLQDDDMRISTVKGTATSPDSIEKLDVTFHPHKKAGQFVATWALPTGALPGAWIVGELEATADTGETLPLAGSVSVNVPGNQSKTTGSVQIPTGTFRETQILPVTVTLAAGLSVKAATVTLMGPKHRVLNQSMIFGTSKAGEALEIPVRLTKGVGVGTWQIARITLTAEDGTVHHLVNGQDFNGDLNVGKGREDTQPPVIDTASLSRASVTTGEQVNDQVFVQALVTDDIAGVGSVFITLTDNLGRQQGATMLTLQDANKWTGNFTLPQYFPAGSWVARLIATDKVGNKMAEPYVLPVTVVASYTDSQPPVVKDVSLDFGNGNLTVTVQLSGDVPAQHVAVQLNPPNVGGRRIVLPLDPVSATTWSRSIPLPEHAAAGDWTVGGLNLQDAIGHQASFAGSELPGAHLTTRVQVDSPDGEPPALDSVTLPATVRAGERVLVTVAAHDKLSGVESVTVGLKGPGSEMKWVLLHLDDTTQNWVGTLVIPTAGTWHLDSVNLEDAAWNIAVVTTGPGFDVALNVR